MPQMVAWQGGEPGHYRAGSRALAASAAHADGMRDGVLRMRQPGAGLSRLQVRRPGHLHAIWSCRREGDRLWPRFLLR